MRSFPSLNMRSYEQQNEKRQQPGAVLAPSTPLCGSNWFVFELLPDGCWRTGSRRGRLAVRVLEECCYEGNYCCKVISYCSCKLFITCNLFHY